MNQTPDQTRTVGLTPTRTRRSADVPQRTVLEWADPSERTPRRAAVEARRAARQNGGNQ